MPVRRSMQKEPSLTIKDRVRLVELPLNSRLEDVVGGINDKDEFAHERMRLRRGILAHADRNLLYIDEVNLLSDEIVDAILDAAAQGTYHGPPRIYVSFLPFPLPAHWFDESRGGKIAASNSRPLRIAGNRARA